MDPVWKEKFSLYMEEPDIFWEVFFANDEEPGHWTTFHWINDKIEGIRELNSFGMWIDTFRDFDNEEEYNENVDGNNEIARSEAEFGEEVERELYARDVLQSFVPTIEEQQAMAMQLHWHSMCALLQKMLVSCDCREPDTNATLDAVAAGCELGELLDFVIDELLDFQELLDSWWWAVDPQRGEKEQIEREKQAALEEQRRQQEAARLKAIEDWQAKNDQAEPPTDKASWKFIAAYALSYVNLPFMTENTMGSGWLSETIEELLRG